MLYLGNVIKIQWTTTEATPKILRRIATAASRMRQMHP